MKRFIISIDLTPGTNPEILHKAMELNGFTKITIIKPYISQVEYCFYTPSNITVEQLRDSAAGIASNIDPKCRILVSDEEHWAGYQLQEAY